MINLLLPILLYPSPKITIDKNQEAQFEKLADQMIQNNGELIKYSLPYPKQHFLYFLSQKGKYMFHGSNNHDIKMFEPREQTLYNGKPTTAVFATTDSIWPMFYAVFRRSSLIGSFRNACLVCQNRRYHYYSLNRSTVKNDPWTNGMIYILPKKTFSKSGDGKIHFDEWVSHKAVKPLGKLAVTMDDFYFHNKVSTHSDNESPVKTWLFYKIRNFKAVNKAK